MTKNYITKPFEVIQERNLFLLGSAILLIASIFAVLTYSRFDGVLDMHIASSIEWYQPLLDNIVNTLCLTILLYLLSLLQPTKTRIVDIINVALISRVPLYLSLLTNIGGINKETTEYLMANLTNPMAITELPVINLVILGIATLIALGALVLMGFLVYKGYKTATNSKSTTHLMLLIPVVLLAEVLSKFLVYLY